jgi:hypothetical protein
LLIYPNMLHCTSNRWRQVADKTTCTVPDTRPFLSRSMLFIPFHLSRVLSACSRRQSCVALSTTEAEFVAASEATREGIWLGQLMKDIIPGWKGPIGIMCDNKSAIDLVKNPVHHQRSKHIDVRFYFVRARQNDPFAGEINVQQISTT